VVDRSLHSPSRISHRVVAEQSDDIGGSALKLCCRRRFTQADGCHRIPFNRCRRTTARYPHTRLPFGQHEPNLHQAMSDTPTFRFGATANTCLPRRLRFLKKYGDHFFSKRSHASINAPRPFHSPAFAIQSSQPDIVSRPWRRFCRIPLVTWHSTHLLEHGDGSLLQGALPPSLSTQLDRR
jgi:hypothetical protein